MELNRNKILNKYCVEDVLDPVKKTEISVMLVAADELAQMRYRKDLAEAKGLNLEKVDWDYQNYQDNLSEEEIKEMYE